MMRCGAELVEFGTKQNMSQAAMNEAWAATDSTGASH